MKASTILSATIVTLLLIGIGVGIYFSRGNASGIPTEAEYENKLKQIDAGLRAAASDIDSLQGDSECLSASDCHILGLGAKTCGGYRNYLIYSRRDVVDEAKLTAAVNHYNELAEQKNSLSYKVLSCGEKPAPVECIEKRCAPAK